MIKLLITDDSPHYRNALKAFLQKDNEVEIVGEACNGREALELTPVLMPDLILMDIFMPQMNGYSATRMISQIYYPIVKIIGLTLNSNDCCFEKLVEAGANGFVYKDNLHLHLKQAIHRVYNGEYYFSI